MNGPINVNKLFTVGCQILVNPPPADLFILLVHQWDISSGLAAGQPDQNAFRNWTLTFTATDLLRSYLWTSDLCVVITYKMI